MTVFKNLLVDCHKKCGRLYLCLQIITAIPCGELDSSICWNIKIIIFYLCACKCVFLYGCDCVNTTIRIKLAYRISDEFNRDQG